MTDLLGQLNEILEKAPKNSKLFKAAQSGGVRHSKELDRIIKLPRRIWTPEASAELAGQMTEVLRTPTGKQSLRPIQAIALLEIGLYGGMLGPMRPGAGKTLVMFLAPYILDAKRPVCLMPAKLRAEKYKQLQELSLDWRVAYWLSILSYEALSRVSKENYLEDIKCDMLLADEAHKLKNPKAACTKRVKEYRKAHAEMPYVPVSGTFMKRSVHDFAPQSDWALGAQSPVPREWPIVEEWANCIDEKPRTLTRTEPGALVIFSGGDDELNAVREGIGRRIVETPGVVASFDTLVDCSLVISKIRLEPDTATYEAFAKLRKDWETPDEWPLVGGLDVYRHARELALGFYYRWIPRAPRPWIEARRDWARFVRDDLAHNRSRRYSELQVALACSRGELDDRAYLAWKNIKKSFVPNTETVWISEVPLRRCIEWAAEGPGIIWTEHTSFANRLSEVSGIPYCGAGGVDKNGRTIESYAGETVIASLRSSGEGRDLQAWDRGLITSPMSSGDAWEQLLARWHRDGQKADEVSADVFSACAEHEQAFAQAQADAICIAKETLQDQRLCYSDVLWPETPDLDIGPVWTR